MARFLIDANLPRLMSIWSGADFDYVHDLDPAWPDTRIWAHAASNGLTIVTKDADFSHRVLATTGGPSVVHIRLGNMRFRDFEAHIARAWGDVIDALPEARLIQVYRDRIETIA